MVFFVDIYLGDLSLKSADDGFELSRLLFQGVRDDGREIAGCSGDCVVGHLGVGVGLHCEGKVGDVMVENRVDFR